MNYFKFFSLIGILLLAACSNSSNHPPPSEKILLARKISKECGEKLSKRYQMSYCGSGGAMMYEIESFYFAFYIFRSLTKEEARALLMDCAQEIIDTVNQNEAIQKYLLPEKFNPKSVDIALFIKPNHKNCYHPEISVCSFSFGNLIYKTKSPDAKYTYKTREVESYDEALALIQKNSSDHYFSN